MVDLTPSFHREPNGCCEATNGNGAPAQCRSVCVAGPLREVASTAGVPHERPFRGLCFQDLPRWNTEGLILTNTFLGCRQIVVAVYTGAQGKAIEDLGDLKLLLKPCMRFASGTPASLVVLARWCL